MARQPLFLGKRIRALRLHAGLRQADLAGRLGISPSYLNLLEHDRRPLPTAVLLELARVLDVDLRTLAAGTDADLAGSLCEIFSDHVFEDHPLTPREVQAFVESSPDIARAVVRLHQGYVGVRESLGTLAERELDETTDLTRLDGTRLSSEQVSDFIHRHGNHFPALEAAAEALLAEVQSDGELFSQLCAHLLRKHGVTVRIATVAEMHGAVRRYDPATRELCLSEVLRRGSRNFQLAVQIGLKECGSTIDALAGDPLLTSDDSRILCRVALASYFAGALLMPYRPFLRAAEAERYDVELLGHRFRVGWEQVCHRLTTLRRPGEEGVPFYMLRVDLAGNITKRFSAAGIRFPRFSGLCSLWNVHAAFLHPGRVRVQLSRLPDGHTVLAVARTVQRHWGGYHRPEAPYAVGIGCDAGDGHRLVYADGLDLTTRAAAVPVGVTCRLCERADCTARAVPSLGGRLQIDENVRGVSFFAPAVR